MIPLKSILRTVNLAFLLGAVLLYAMGASLAHYLGARMDWELYWLGQSWVTCLQLAGIFLFDYFDKKIQKARISIEVMGQDFSKNGEIILPFQTILQVGYGFLAILASLTVLMIWRFQLPMIVYFGMGLAVIGVICYCVPPIRLENSGYGELLLSILMAFGIPTFSFLLLANNLHRFLAMATFPLVFLYLAMMLGRDLPRFGSDLRLDVRTLLVRIGWRRGIVLHNLLILFAYLILALAVTSGFPWFAALPAFFTLPVGLLQIWQISRIAGGAKPNWYLLLLNAGATVYLMAYLFTYTFLIH